MDYKRIYDDLIAYRQQNVLSIGYIEKHHILPRSLGGTDDTTNLVALTGREHYVAHLLLARFNRCSQTAYALWMMQMKSSKDCNRPCIKSGRMYEWARKEFIMYISENAKITSKGERNSQYGLCWITDGINNIKIVKNQTIAHGWVLGRTLKSQTKYFTCGYCNISFTNKKKKKYCSKECEHSSKPDIVKTNFIALKTEYDKHKCLSKAFNDNNIGYNGNLFKKFFNLYNKAEVA
jgi:hypothetical protein